MNDTARLGGDMDDIREEIWRIRNRQVGRLLKNLSPFKFPDIVIDAIKKYFDYMAEDIENMVRNKENNDEQGYNR